MEEIITKEIAQKLMEIEGEARGIHLKNDAEYILTEKGEEGLKKVEEELESLGFSIDYKKIKNLEFYPAGLRILSLLATKKTFNWDDDEIRKMCRFAARASFIVKMYLKFFYSVPKLMEKASKMWREYWTEGKLIVKDYSEKERYAVLRIEGSDLHPIYCRCLEGYFKGLTKMVVKTEKPECLETECSFRGGKDHEFLIKW
jgi:hypothetical protein